MQRIYLLIGEAQSGPYSEKEVREMYVAGQIDRETLHWTEDMTTWEALGPLDDPTSEPVPTPKTIAPPRRTLRPGKYSIEHKPVKSEDEIEEELSRSSKPARILTTLATIVVCFVALTGLLKIISHTVPDLGKKFTQLVTNAGGQH